MSRRRGRPVPPGRGERGGERRRGWTRRSLPRFLRAAAVVALAALAACHPRADAERARLLAADAAEYAYPIADPYVATVVGTPPSHQVALPREIRVSDRELPPLEQRAVPEPLWFHTVYRYTIAAQPGRAPLIFIVPGTNAGRTSRFATYLQKLFYVAGFHAVALSSPTTPNFMVTASSTGVPGRTSRDAADLYRVMLAVLQDLEQDVIVSDVSLVGFSLGAWYAAFVAALDDRQQALGLRKTLLVNPPVSLYRSSLLLDRLFEQNIPGGYDGLRPFLDRLTAQLQQAYTTTGGAQFSAELLYDIFARLRPSEQELKALVGLTFRVLSANIAFTADLLSDAGYLVPPERTLRISTSLTPYFDEAMRHGFQDYFEDLLYPYYAARSPGLGKAEMIAESDMATIESFLRTSPRVALITNADDIILAPGDLAFLRSTFGERARVFPSGGHGGNLEDRQVAAAILQQVLE